jgi:hypothetical protein
MAGIPNQQMSTKTMLSTLKVERSSKFILGQPDKICRFDPKSKKIIETPNQPIKTKIFRKEKCKRAKNSYEGYPYVTEKSKKSLKSPKT